MILLTLTLVLFGFFFPAKFALYTTVGRGPQFSVTPSDHLMSHLRFAFKGDDGASILITGASNDEKYNILLSGIARSYIQDANTKSVLMQQTMNQLYNHGNFTDFWIGWTGGVLEVGKGNAIGRNVFLKTEKVISMVTDVSIGTINQHTGSWNVKKGRMSKRVEYILRSECKRVLSVSLFNNN